MKTHLEALMVLMREARRETSTVTAYKRALRACAVLSLDQQTINDVMAFLDYHNSKGEMYEWLRGKL